ncbi:transposase [Streptomyces spororaveus]|uniref:transposase n=1 Tax=Streptomyces spororaveus TaxID=284039 RepID=UPI00379BA4EB
MRAWAVLGPLLPAVKATGRPPVDRRTVVEATAWRFRTGAPWRDLPERFGNWNVCTAGQGGSPGRGWAATSDYLIAAEGAPGQWRPPPTGTPPD